MYSQFFPKEKTFCLVGDGLEVGELLEGALLGEELLVEDATEGDHGEAAVLDLYKAAAGEGDGVLSKAKGIKAQITGLTALREHVTGCQLELVRGELDGADCEKHLPEASSGDHEEVIDRGGAVRELGKAHSLLGNHAGPCEHAHATVLELGLTEPLDIKVVGEANGIEANIAGKGAVERGGALEEGHGKVLLHAEAADLGHGSCIQKKKASVDLSHCPEDPQHPIAPTSRTSLPIHSAS